MRAPQYEDRKTIDSVRRLYRAILSSFACKKPDGTMLGVIVSTADAAHAGRESLRRRDIMMTFSLLLRPWKAGVAGQCCPEVPCSNTKAR
jgi:hypothetical protein